MKNLIALTPKRNSFSQPDPNVCVSLNVMLCASMLPLPAPNVAPASPWGRVAGRSRTVFWLL